MRVFLSLVILVFSLNTHAQFRVAGGTSLTILPGTIFTAQIHENNFVIDSAAFVINHGKIQLGDSTDLIEFINYPITGTGTETANRNLANLPTYTNLAGLGLKINTDSLDNTFYITRGHGVVWMNGTNQSIKRWFKLTTTDTLGFPLEIGFIYDPTEINGNTASSLKSLISADTTASWAAIGGNAITGNNEVVFQCDSLGYFTLTESDLFLLQMNDTVFCKEDTLVADFNSIGYFNSNNEFVLEISDEFGSFSAPVFIDTVLNSSIDFNAILGSGFLQSSNYKIRIQSSSPQAYSNEFDLAIFDQPLVPTITRIYDTLFSSSTTGNQWYFNGSPLPGETGNYTIATANGFYEVETNNYGCKAISDTFNYFYLNDQTSKIDNGILIFPNPFKDVFFIENNSKNSVFCNLFNSNGQLILKENIIPISTRQEILLQNLPSGVYTLQVNTLNEIIVYRIIKIE